MFCTKAFIFLILVSITAVKCLELSYLQRIFDKSDISSSRSGSNYSKVFFGHIVCRIYYYDPAHGFANKTLPKWFMCISCTIAENVRAKLINIIKVHPLIYEPIFIHDGKDESDFTEPQTLEASYQCKKVLKFIPKITQYINIILNFMNAHKNDSHFDTLLLKSLLSLYVKCNYIVSLCTKNENFFNKNDAVLIQMILEEINLINYFLALNCLYPTSYDNRQFHDPNPMFYSNIPLALYTDNDYLNSGTFNMEQVLLLKVFSTEIDFNGIKWTTVSGDVDPSEVVKGIKKSYDLELIYWYMDTLFKTLVKLLLEKILKCFHINRQLSQDFLTQFSKLYEDVFINLKNIPFELIECLMVLSKSPYPDEYLTLTLNTYTSSLNTIKLLPKHSPGTLIDLDIFHVQLLSIVPDLQCFVKIYDYLLIEYNTYFVPFKKNPLKIKSFVDKFIKNKMNNEMENFKAEGCKYVQGLYHLSFEAMSYINYMKSAFLDTPKSYHEDYEYTIMKLKNYLIDSGSGDLYPFLAQIVFNIVPQLEFSSKNLLKNENYDDLKRLIFTVMCELNQYFLAFCCMQNYTFLIISNLDFDINSRLMKKIDKAIISSMNEMRKLQNNETERVFRGLKDFDDLLQNSNIIKLFDEYSGVIEFDWKGERNISIIKIYQNIRITFVVNSYYFYAFYDLCFKFSLAVIYYELNILYKYNLDPDISTTMCNVFKTLFHNLRKKIKSPTFFDNFKYNIEIFAKWFLVLVCKKTIDNMPDKLIVTEKLENSITRFGISINMENDKKNYINNSLIRPKDFNNHKNIYKSVVTAIENIMNAVNLIYIDFVKIFDTKPATKN